MKKLLAEAMEQKEETRKHRRTLHALAEVGFELPKSTDYVMNYLQKRGLSPRAYDTYGVSADIRSKREDAPVLLLRADMDALPMEEKSGLTFAAKNGNAHTCGHDLHAAMLLGAVPLLLRRKESLRCHVRVMLQGAEETLGGARRMLADGVGEGVKAAYMLHAITACPYRTGTLLLPPAGKAAPAAAFFQTVIRGEGGHGGLGTTEADALRIAVTTAAVLSSLPLTARLSLGQLEAGRAANVLPTEAALSGTVRHMEESKMEETFIRIESAARQVAELYGGKSETRITSRCPPLRIDCSLRERARETLRLLLGEERVVMTEQPSGASEDFALIAERCPSLTVAIAAGKREEGFDASLHHPRARFDEEALPIGAAAYAALALGDL